MKQPITSNNKSTNITINNIKHKKKSPIQKTPIVSGIKSPNDLLIAKPGKSSFCNQTLNGPTLLLLILFIRPPFWIILIFSFGFSGLWSSLIWWGVFDFVMYIALKSPML